jgi:hypothetical protein
VLRRKFPHGNKKGPPDFSRIAISRQKKNADTGTRCMAAPRGGRRSLQALQEKMRAEKKLAIAQRGDYAYSYAP